MFAHLLVCLRSRKAGKCPVDDHHAELDLFLATLSTGPVGFGDGLHDTNRSLLMRCCAADGRILAPSLPPTPIDATWASLRRTPATASASASVWTAHSRVNGSEWHFVVAIDVPTSFPLLPSDFYPVITGAVVSRAWHSPECEDGARASTCGVMPGLPDAKTGVPVGGGPLGSHRWELTVVSPVLPPGVALLGELDKATPVSPARFTAVVAGADGVRVQVSGEVGERVRVVFAVGVGGADTGTVKVVSLVIARGGVASVFVRGRA